ncbi:MAG: TIGR00730 family Rossman fold protein [Verrucomicrobiae bacterium]|nr:TIGR00730 family Rossman fold protein [Verrucomicrobiae bacterium]
MSSSVCVFCGSSPGSNPAFLTAAEEVGRWLGGHGHALVYGGANRGLMKALADSALAAGGRVIGVLPEKLLDLEIAHRGLTELRVVADMHERKATMASLADAFLALPGGMGTLEELAEAFVWTQLGYHRKPCGVLDIDGYYQPFLELLDHMVESRFLKAEQRAQWVVGTDPGETLERLLASRPQPMEKWLDTP